MTTLFQCIALNRTCDGESDILIIQRPTMAELETALTQHCATMALARSTVSFSDIQHVQVLATIPRK